MDVNHLIGFDGLITGRLRARYKRFFADIELDSGDIITAHCPNPGKMAGLLYTGAPALCTHINDPKKKLQYRLEALQDDDVWVGVNTQWPNRLIYLTIEAGLVPELKGYTALKPEVRYGHNSRIDIQASGHAFLPDAYIEIKNVHFSRQQGLAEFPDCVTERGAKHLYELIEMVKTGYRALVVFCVQRNDCTRFDIARDCDPGFSKAYDAARAAGVEFKALGFAFTPSGLDWSGPLDIELLEGR